MNALNHLLKKREEVISNVKLIFEMGGDTSELEFECRKYADEMSLLIFRKMVYTIENN